MRRLLREPRRRPTTRPTPTRRPRRFDQLINTQQQHMLGDLMAPDAEVHHPKVRAVRGCGRRGLCAAAQ
jgi:hypothetical protein